MHAEGKGRHGPLEQIIRDDVSPPHLSFKLT